MFLLVSQVGDIRFFYFKFVLFYIFVWLMSVPHTYLKGHTYPVVIASRITFLAIEHKPYGKLHIY